MRFGTVDTFLSLNRDDLRIGRNVANHEFLKALLTTGTFDEYHVFLPDWEHLEVFRQHLALLVPDPYLRRRVRPTLQIALKERLEELEFTVFHQGDFTRFLPYLAPLRDRYARNRFPLTGTTHSLNLYLMAQRYLQLGLARLAPFDAIVCTSAAGALAVRKGYDQMRQRMLEGFGLDLPLEARLEQIPLGIDDARFELPDKAAARRQLQLPADATLALVLGRMSTRAKMDPVPLLEALADRWRAGGLPSLTLVLAGGAESAELQALKRRLATLEIADRVIVRPDFDEADKSAYYAASDVFLALSDNLQETFGLSVVEAMAAGLAPIVSDYDGYRELVDHGRTGFRIPTLWGYPIDAVQDLEPILAAAHPFFLAQTFAVDLDATLEALERLTLDEPLRQAMGTAARARAEELRWSSVIKRYEALWLELDREARTTLRPPLPPPHPLESELFETFAHYPTVLLEPDHRLRLTAAGRSRWARRDLPAPAPDFEPLLFMPVLEAVLGALELASATVDALVLAVQPLHVPPATVQYHLLWLVKYGLVGLEAPVAPRDP